jgi:hypothetical protein
LNYVKDVWAYFKFGDFSGYFLKNWAIFSKSSGHPVQDFSDKTAVKVKGQKIILNINQNYKKAR